MIQKSFGTQFENNKLFIPIFQRNFEKSKKLNNSFSNSSEKDSSLIKKMAK